jgi:hypothetical protein
VSEEKRIRSLPKKRRRAQGHRVIVISDHGQFRRYHGWEMIRAFFWEIGGQETAAVE